MKWMSWAAFVLLCASCAAPTPPTDWTVERLAPDVSESAETATAICDEMRGLALGSHADRDKLTDTLDELARISAVVGATAALPELNRASAALDAGAEQAEVHDELVKAAEAIDGPSSDFCDLPMFTAVYATSGWPSCHGELAIPVAGYTLVDPDRGCSSVGSPSFLPCWSETAPFLPLDCYTGDVLQVVDGGWQPAGAPHEVRPGTTVPPVTEDEPEEETVPVVSLIALPECNGLVDLFTGLDPVDGSAQSLERLRAATAELEPGVGVLIEEFITAKTGTPNLAEFEAIVLQLDVATVIKCGLPLISAWDALAGGVDEIPCWSETGLAIPAYAPAECGD